MSNKLEVWLAAVYLVTFLIDQSYSRELQEGTVHESLFDLSTFAHSIAVHPDYPVPFNLKIQKYNRYYRENERCTLEVQIPNNFSLHGGRVLVDIGSNLLELSTLTTTKVVGQFIVFQKTSLLASLSTFTEQLRAAVFSKNLTEGTSWIIDLILICGETTESVALNLSYSKTIQTELLMENGNSWVTESQTFSVKVARIYEPVSLLSQLEIHYTDPTMRLPFAKFHIFSGDLIMEGEAPVSRNKRVSTFYSKIYLIDLKSGMKSVEFNIQLEVRPNSSVNWPAIFILCIMLGFVFLIVCLLVIIAKQSTENHVQIVADALPKKEVLTNSVLEWKKEADLNKSQLDQTVINEMYLFKEAEMKKEKKKRAYEIEEEGRPPPVDLACIKKDPKDDVLTPGYSLNVTQELRKTTSGNDITLDLSPIRIKKGVNFEMRSPQLAALTSSEIKPNPGQIVSSGLKLNIQSVSDKKLISEDSPSPGLALKRVESEEFSGSPHEPLSPANPRIPPMPKLDFINESAQEGAEEEEIQYELDS